MNVEELADRLAIGDLLTRYTVAIDTKDYGQLASVFAPDAVIDYTAVGGVRGGREEVVSWLERTLSFFPMTQHLLGQSAVSLEGDRATSRTYFYNPMAWKDGDGRLRLFSVGGYYNDRLERRPEGWRIVERVEENAWFDGELPEGIDVPS